ncbi:hypothetical protein V8C44DRAFT_330208 [Trichoderma aethiopicum]
MGGNHRTTLRACLIFPLCIFPFSVSIGLETLLFCLCELGDARDGCWVVSSRVSMHWGLLCVWIFQLGLAVFRLP